MHHLVSILFGTLVIDQLLKSWRMAFNTAKILTRCCLAYGSRADADTYHTDRLSNLTYDRLHRFLAKKFPRVQFLQFCNSLTQKDSQVRIPSLLLTLLSVFCPESQACHSDETIFRTRNHFLIGRAGKGMAVSTHAAVDAYKWVSDCQLYTRVLP